MGEWPSPSGSPAALDHVCADADARHRRVRANLALVRRLLGEVADPVGAAVATQFEELAVDLERHCAREEQILWPSFAALAEAARRGQPRPPLPFPTMLHPVRLMESEHARLGARLDGLRELVAGLAPPAASAERWRRACEGIATLDAAITDHVRFENEVLYPEALEVERRLG